jgi:uncharacterized lipoprotein
MFKAKERATMKTSIAALLLLVSALAGCASTSNHTVGNSADQDYLYGRHAGEPQRPSLMM